MLYIPDTQKENRPNQNDLSQFISKLSKKEKKKPVEVELIKKDN